MSEEKNSRDVVLDLLRTTPMMTIEIEKVTGYRNSVLNNIMTNLKNKSLIEVHTHGLGGKNNHWKAVKNAPTYASIVQVGKTKQQTSQNTIFSPNASMKVSIGDYHVSGNKSKVNSWAGYGSFNFV